METLISRYKRAILLCILFGFSWQASAQVGFKFGLSASSFTFRNALVPEGEYELDLRPYLGYDIEWVQFGEQKPIFFPYFSIYVPCRISGRFSVVPELSFLQKGVSFNQSEFERIVYQVKINYLEVPLSLTYSWMKKKKSRSDLYLGGYGSLKIRAVKRTATHFSPLEVSVLSQVNRFEVGIHGGFNYMQTIAGHHFLIDLRIFHGLTNIFSLPEEQTPIYHQVQSFSNTGFLISIGYEI